MGYKRPFDSEELQELPFKQTRQLEYGNKVTQFSDSSSLDAPAQKCKNIVLENSDGLEASNLAKDFEMHVPLSWVSCERSGLEALYIPSLSPEYTESSIPRRTVVPSDNVNVSYLDNYSRKLVPVGPNHQASIPPLSTLVGDHKAKMAKSYDTGKPSVSGSQRNMCSESERFLGTCIIPMPETGLLDGYGSDIGTGRTEFYCMDEGSVRCMRQHIVEAREKIRKTLGNETFVGLGFYEMGEDVAYNWSDEEEHIFRSVVYSNPASLGYNFWNHIRPVFPGKTMKEIVSYYFNVFMLRRRAAQNRSSMLDIDSDDDEVHGISKTSNVVQYSDEDEDSGLEYSVDEYEQLDQKEDIVEDNSDDDGDSSNGDADARDRPGAVTGDDSDINENIELIEVQSSDASKFCPVSEQTNKKVTNDKADFTVQDDLCMSYEFQADKFETYPHLHDDNSFQENEAKTTGHGKYVHLKVDHHYPDVGTHTYLTDVCDGKIWDARYTSASGPIKGFDLLPTSNIIEEIFGQESLDGKRNF